MTAIKICRIYEKEQPAGYRILVDRLWPRGMSKVRAKLDLWDKEIAPSKELRQWFNHDDSKYPAFKAKYEAELEQNPATNKLLQLVKEKLAEQDVLFLYGAKNKEHNQAVVLQEYLTAKL